MTGDKYPTWVCDECGAKYGRRLPDVATWHEDTCDICARHRAVTEPRDFGHLRPEWEDKK